MGYRSDVAYIIQFDTFEQRDMYVNLKLALVPDDAQHKAMLECDYSSKSRPIITFKAEDVKWYESYEDVQAHSRLYEDAKEVIDSAKWRFIRLGENSDDIEEQSDDDGLLFDDLYVVRRIETSFE